VPGSRQIYGLGRICPCLNENSPFFNPIIRRLGPKSETNPDGLGFPNKFLCAVCQDIKAYPYECPYKLQFKDLPNAVFMPVEYAGTEVLKEYRPHIIAVDDCLLRKKDHLTRAKIEFWFRNLPKDLRKEFTYTLKQLVEMDDEEFQNVMAYIKDYEDYLRGWIIERVKQEDPNLENYIADWQEVEIYLYYAKLYGMRDQFSTPYLFYLFDYIFEHPRTKLIIIEALPQTLRFLNMLAERYEHETGRRIVFNCREVKFKGKLPESVIYRCHGAKLAWYPTSSSVTTSKITRTNIIRIIRHILKSRHTHESSPGFVVPKAVKKIFQEEFEVSEDSILTFGDLRGKNSLEHCNPLFVVGTYNINRENLLNDFNLWFPNDPVTSDALEDEKPHGGRYVYKDKRLDFFRWLKEDYEQYQAIMRCRPLNYQREIYHFGEIPKELPDVIERGGNPTFTFFEDGSVLIEDRVKWLEDLVKKEKAIPLDAVIKLFQQKYDLKTRWWAREKILKLLKQTKNIGTKWEGRLLIWIDEYK